MSAGEVHHPSCLFTFQSKGPRSPKGHADGLATVSCISPRQICCNGISVGLKGYQRSSTFSACLGCPSHQPTLSEREDDIALKVLRRLPYKSSNGEWIGSGFIEIKATISTERDISASGPLVIFTVLQWRTRRLVCTAVQVFTQNTRHQHHHLLTEHHVRNTGNRG